MSDGNTWPEQESVDAWLSEMGLDIDNLDSMKLKKAVTQPRIEVQQEISDLKRKLSDSIQREQEVELELEETKGKLTYCNGLNKMHREKWLDERAHADALAGFLYNWQQEIPFIKARLSARGKNQSLGLEKLEENTDKALKAYRNREE